MIAELWPGRGFHEESDDAHHATRGDTSAPSNRTATTKTVVRDRLTFELRGPLRC